MVQSSRAYLTWERLWSRNWYVVCGLHLCRITWNDEGKCSNLYGSLATVSRKVMFPLVTWSSSSYTAKWIPCRKRRLVSCNIWDIGYTRWEWHRIRNRLKGNNLSKKFRSISQMQFCKKVPRRNSRSYRFTQ